MYHYPNLDSAFYWMRHLTNQKHYPDLGSDESSVWNFCTCYSDIILWGNQRWHRKMLAHVFSGYFSNELRDIPHSTKKKKQIIQTEEYGINNPNCSEHTSSFNRKIILEWLIPTDDHVHLIQTYTGCPALNFGSTRPNALHCTWS